MKKFGIYETLYNTIQDHGIFKHLRFQLVLDDPTSTTLMCNDKKIGVIRMLEHGNGNFEYQSDNDSSIRSWDIGYVAAKLLENSIVQL